jgi:diguanylate cyclase (GGDEF)-like protein
MIPAPIPANEAERLRALESLDLLHTPPEERFDRITRLASRLLKVPIALVTLVSEDEQWFKSAVGLEAPSTGRDISFCGHAIFAEKSFVVEDASLDERFADNPLVVNDPNIRFYAGEPVRRDGMCVGTLCVIAPEPRSFTATELETLKDLAALVEIEFDRAKLTEAQSALLAERSELERRASIDHLTRLWNRSAIFALLEKETARAKRGANLTIAMIDIDDFKKVNDTYGHATGDWVLSEVAQRLRGAVRESDCLGRYGGEEFLAILGDCGAADADLSTARMLASVSREPIVVGTVEIHVTVSIGYACFGGFTMAAGNLLESADAALYRAKLAGRNRVVAAGDGEHLGHGG